MAKRPTKKVAKKLVRSVGRSRARAVKARPHKAASKARRVVASQAPPAAPPLPPPPAVLRPEPEALAAFERGMTALQRHDYTAAAKAFEGLLSQFPNERFLADRARVYRELAARELRKRPAGNGTVEERLTAATLALNNHDDREAARLAADVLREDRKQDLAAYLLAVVAARQGDVGTALTHLQTAISINPECRLQARQDEEFDPLLDSDEYHQLVEPPAMPAPLQARRAVRRSGR